ncbi:hypothetical protein JH146_1637 [Methanocaldococcus bathoardescens]|uniref:Uncharacterized protein n=1 Tax=Methanocaldococcus bathoardescens TaxID=1301915 RepID=A0A076LLC3_9EURY|nr:DUF2226 domain-containing protein [Methanocaldococcus bathoardescens]AIJ06479.1 hypothetical protein JH146_1637 [Methanocaldococcus bathoardescens]
MIKVVEGELIKTLTDGKLEDIVTELGTGYILILLKDNNKLHEGCIFVEDGEIVGYFYTDNESTEICGNAEKVLELLNHENKIIELYRYDKDKLNLMKWLYPEIFVIKKTEKRESKEEKKTEESGEEKYLNIKLNIPLDVPIAVNVKDFEAYLNDNKYIVINVYRKISGMFENGYIIYKGKTPIAAAYECNYGVLLGEDAYKKIEQMLNDENTVIDVYEYDEKKLNVLLDVYPEMKIEDEKKEIKKEIDRVDRTDSVSISETNDVLGKVGEEEVELSREELLKKLGLTEPDEEWVETILEDFIRPSDEELQELKKKIEREIIENVKNIDGVDDVKPDINVKWENGRYFIFGDVNVKRKRILGIIKKDVEPSIVKFEIDKVIKKNISKYTSRISINIE